MDISTAKVSPTDGNLSLRLFKAMGCCAVRQRSSQTCLNLVFCKMFIISENTLESSDSHLSHLSSSHFSQAEKLLLHGSSVQYSLKKQLQSHESSKKTLKELKMSTLVKFFLCPVSFKKSLCLAYLISMIFRVRVTCYSHKQNRFVCKQAIV